MTRTTIARTAVVAVTTAALTGLAAGAAHAAIDKQQASPPAVQRMPGQHMQGNAGMERMQQLHMQGNPGMQRMHDLHRQGNPGMERMHERMSGQHTGAATR